jgi:hypothetical protein
MADKLDQRIQRIERQVSGLEQDLLTIAGGVPKSDRENTFTDTVWSCTKCGFRLGVYDTKEDTLRVRYKDFYAWWKAGVGGELKIICRGCSEINNLSYTESET